MRRRRAARTHLPTPAPHREAAFLPPHGACARPLSSTPPFPVRMRGAGACAESGARRGPALPRGRWWGGGRGAAPARWPGPCALYGCAGTCVTRGRRCCRRRRFLLPFFLPLPKAPGEDRRGKRSAGKEAGRGPRRGAMMRRTKPEVERYVASVQAAAPSPREVSAAGGGPRRGSPTDLLRPCPSCRSRGALRPLGGRPARPGSVRPVAPGLRGGWRGAAAACPPSVLEGRPLPAQAGGPSASCFAGAGGSGGGGCFLPLLGRCGARAGSALPFLIPGGERKRGLQRLWEYFLSPYLLTVSVSRVR